MCQEVCHTIHDLLKANLCVAQRLSRGTDREGPREGSMHLAHVIADQISNSCALALVVHLTQLSEGFHLHHHQ